MAMGQWWSFTDTMIDTERDMGGTYELGDSSKSVIYIGSSGQVKTRLRSHKRGADGACTAGASFYRVDYRDDYGAEEGRRLATFSAVHGRLPRCNDRL